MFFDNLQVTHTRGPVLESNHYYPFGLNMSGITSKAAGKFENKIRYNSMEQQNKEFSDGSGLEWYDYKNRFYDNQTGKFLCVDKLASEFPYYSPYQFAGNEVPNAIDLDGLENFRPNGPRYGQSNYAQERRSYREINSYVPRASSYRTGARYIPNQTAGSAPKPADIYEPAEFGTGAQHTGPFLPRGDARAQAGTRMLDMVDAIGELKSQIDQISETTDHLINSQTAVTASSIKITWKSKAAETQFNKYQNQYNAAVKAIETNTPMPTAPGKNASQQEKNAYVKALYERALSVTGQIALLGPSPTQVIANGLKDPKGDFKKVETTIHPIEEVRAIPYY